MLWNLSGDEALARASSVISILLFAFYAIRLCSGVHYNLGKLYEEHRRLLTVLKTGPPAEIEKGMKE
jgi:hypothetical protein